VFADSLANWWNITQDTLPPESKRLASLADADLQALGCAYGDLRTRPAAISQTGRRRRVGPRAATKLLYFIRRKVTRRADPPPSDAASGSHPAMISFW
jgi:hypothetical protein